jgi:Flp pilus assembly protein TadG
MIMIKKFFKADKGMAGIEAALIMPFMLLLYFSLHDLTALITFNRKITSTASTIADVVGQAPQSSPSSTTKAIVLDDLQAAAMIMQPTPMADVHVDIFDYRGTSAIPVWQAHTTSGPACAAPSITNMPALMSAGNDVIVAVACMSYTPYVATFFGTNLLGQTSFMIQQTITSRPRAAATLTCYNSGTSGAVCS